MPNLATLRTISYVSNFGWFGHLDSIAHISFLLWASFRPKGGSVANNQGFPKRCPTHTNLVDRSRLQAQKEACCLTHHNISWQNQLRHQIGDYHVSRQHFGDIWRHRPAKFLAWPLVDSARYRRPFLNIPLTVKRIMVVIFLILVFWNKSSL